jgi:hypothetical protein
MLVRKNLGLISLLSLLITSKLYCQDPSEFHPGGVPTPSPFQEYKPRPCKTSIDAGLVFGFAHSTGYTSNYVNGISTSLGYTFGLIEEIPVEQKAYLEVGIEILEDQVSFNSYYFANGYSFLYNGMEIYNHDIVMDELQIPVLFKTPIGEPDRKLRGFFMTFGAKFRYISYTNTSVTSDQTGYLVYDGEKDVTSLYKFFSPFASPIIEISLGYQRNVKKKRKRGWFMSFEYNYGVFPLVYSGNRDGSNYVVFRLNTLLFKVGKIF